MPLTTRPRSTSRQGMMRLVSMHVIYRNAPPAFNGWSTAFRRQHSADADALSGCGRLKAVLQQKNRGPIRVATDGNLCLGGGCRCTDAEPATVSRSGMTSMIVLRARRLQGAARPTFFGGVS